MRQPWSSSGGATTSVEPSDATLGRIVMTANDLLVWLRKQFEENGD